MGEMAEYYCELEMMKSFVKEHRAALTHSNSRELTWTTRGGEVYVISEMTDSHLVNAIHHIERRDGSRGESFLNKAPTYKGMVEELIDRNKIKYNYFDLKIKERLKVKIV